MLVEDAVVPERLVARRGHDPYHAWPRTHIAVHRHLAHLPVRRG